MFLGQSVSAFVLLLSTPLWAQSLGPIVSTPGGIPLPGGVSLPGDVSTPEVSLPGDVSTPALPVSVPNTQGTCDCPLIPNLDALVCILDWISHVKILDKQVRTVNGTTFNQYTLEHIDIIKGTLALPTVLVIPEGPCGLELDVDLEYLLSGLVTGQSNLYSVLCLQVLNVLSPLWSVVPTGLVNQLGLLATVQDLVCKLLDGLLGPILGQINGLIPTVLQTLPLADGL